MKRSTFGEGLEDLAKIAMGYTRVASGIIICGGSKEKQQAWKAKGEFGIVLAIRLDNPSLPDTLKNLALEIDSFLESEAFNGKTEEWEAEIE